MDRCQLLLDIHCTMNLEKQQRAAKILQRVIELPPEVRDRMLESLCDGDAELITWCREILEHDSISADLTADPSDTPDTEIQSELEGEEIGAYRLGENIGSGGMGTVYRSRRIDREFDQEVAIKVLHRNIDARHLKSEQQILAQLDHPNIARLIDAGTTDQDRSYVVMEYIKGAPITEYAGRNQLTIKQRLLLFISLCDAVSFAHKNLIVHRDLKPANILVDEDGNVKLLDFGIAKLLPSNQALTTYLHTQTANRRLTPAYASPEQITGKLISTSSDVYSLGVILYELLTGKRPFEDLESDAREHEQAILDTDPQAPSRRLSSSVSAQGRSKTDLIPRKIRGDLDNIVLKALSADPEDRYVSAQEFSNDVLAYLLGKPVNARRVGAVTKGWKFIKRHKIAVGISAMIIAAVGYQQYQIIQERDIARTERDTALQTKEFLVGLFQGTDSDNFTGETPSVEQLLDKGIENIDSSLNVAPEIQIEIKHTVARALRSMGEFEKSEKQLLEALSLFNSHTQSIAYNPAWLYMDLSIVSSDLSKHADSIEYAKTAIQIGITDDASEKYDLAYANHIIAVSYRKSHDYELSLAHEQQAIDLEFSKHQKSRPQYAQYRHGMGRVLMDLGKYKESLEAMEDADDLASNFTEKTRWKYLLSNDMATVEHRLGEYEKAERRYINSIALLDSLHDKPTHDHVYVYSNYGSLLNDMNEIERASVMIKTALDYALEAFDPKHQQIAIIKNNLATSYYKSNSFDEAEYYFSEAYDHFVELFGKQTQPSAIMLNNLGNVNREKGNYDKASQYLNEALTIRIGIVGADSPAIHGTYRSVGQIGTMLGEYDKAHEALTQSLAILNEHSPEDSDNIGRTRLFLVQNHLMRGEFTQAKTFADGNEDLLRAHYPHNDWRIALSKIHGYLLNPGQVDNSKINDLLVEMTNQLTSRHPTVSQVHNLVQNRLSDPELFLN